MIKETPAECEACNNSGIVILEETGKEKNILVRINGLYLCSDCEKLEKKAIEEKHMSPEMQQVRVDKARDILEMSRKIDTSLQVRTDLFNAETISITELKNAIETDDSIDNKRFALATTLQERIAHFQELIREKQNELVDATTKQRATQSYLNQLANSLRSEEREKLKLSDINYRPPVTIKSVKPTTIKRKAIDKAELKKYAAELNISEFTLQMIVVQKNCTVEEAANMLRKSINESISEVK